MPTPVAVAPVAPAPTNGAVKPTAPVAASAAPVTEATFEVTVDGKPTKLTRKQIEKFAGKGAYTDQVLRQAKEAIAATKKADAERAERESIWDDEERLEAELEKRGKLDVLARKRLAKKLAEQEMTPEQRAIAERDAKIADLEKTNKAAEEERAQQRLSENAKRIHARIESELDSAWERAGFERNNPDTFYAVYEAMKEMNDLGLLNAKDFTAADADRICEAARENIDGAYKRLESNVAKGLKGKALFDRLGKQVVDELNRYQIELIRGGGAKRAAQAAEPVKPAAKPDEYLTLEQARAKVREMGK
jgi:NADH dehydrogenase/NADH:ubiquinone oxidoreductase subunit G